MTKSTKSTASKRKPKQDRESIWTRLKPRILNGGLLLLVTLCIYLLIRPQIGKDLNGFKLGLAAPRVVTAPFQFEFTDQITTTRRIDEAVRRVPPMYNTNPGNLTAMLDRVEQLKTAAREIERSAEEPINQWAARVTDKAGVSLENRTYGSQETLGELPASTFEALFFYKDYQVLWKSIQENIQTSIGNGIADNIDPLRESQTAMDPSQQGRAVTVGVHLIDPDGTERMLTSGQDIFTLDTFFQRFEHVLERDFPNADKDAVVRNFALDIVKASYAGPTLLFNQEETEKKRELSRDRIDPEMVLVEKGDIIIGRNDIVTLQDMQKIEAMREQLRVSAPSEFGYIMLAAIFTFMVVWYIRSYYSKLAYFRGTAVIFLSIILMLALARVFFQVSLLDLGSDKLSRAGFGVPMGALGVVVRVLAGTRMAMFACTITSIYTGFILGGGGAGFELQYLIVSIITSWGAVYTVSRIRQRSDLYRAGGVVIIVACFLIVAVTLQQHKSFELFILQAETLKWSLIWGAVNGFLVSILSIALLPIFEDLIGITTDIKLLELSQKNELMQRLEQEAPGSYQHSMRVATLAETASDAVGANALLTRVGCYYHDIGKMEKPQYFVENQQTSADRAKHSKLSPNMSCLIIRNHVKHGLELGKEYNLPKAIMDFIPEHHGTTLMSYFYHEAVTNQDNEGKIKEEDFRYPGPKPQSKETAIVMLADALEASSRTLESASERDVRQLVRKIINDRFMDGQFDECNLTLKDLHTLYHSFTASILHMLHQRIHYPNMPTPKAKETEPSKGTDAKEKQAEPDPQPVAIKTNKESSDTSVKQEKEVATKETPVAIKENSQGSS